MSEYQTEQSALTENLLEIQSQLAKKRIVPDNSERYRTQSTISYIFENEPRWFSTN